MGALGSFKVAGTNEDFYFLSVHPSNLELMKKMRTHISTREKFRLARSLRRKFGKTQNAVYRGVVQTAAKQELPQGVKFADESNKHLFGIFSL